MGKRRNAYRILVGKQMGRDHWGSGGAVLPS
jgi:hypothetical protein